MRPRLYLPPPPRASNQEWLDDPSRAHLTRFEIADSFLEINRLNRLAGATRAVSRLVFPFVSSEGSRVLDVGTGIADTPLALYEQARARGFALEIHALDANQDVLAAARRFVRNAPITLVQGDARLLPYKSSSFDVVLCLGLIHHFDADDAVTVLKEMWRVTKTAVVVADLERSYVLSVVGPIALRALARQRLTRHDGIASVKRAYTAGELIRLARRADLANIRLKRRPLFLQALIATK